MNLNQNHSEEDLKKICDYLEETLDTKILQYSIHRDEGHVTTDEKAIKNYHAHIEFMGLDSLGASVRKKLDRKTLITLQDKTAELLEMERGRNYTQEKAPRPKRLGTYEYKKHKEEESKNILSKQKDLKIEMAKIREELQKNKAVRENYRELEILNNELKIKIKNKELTIRELQLEIQKYLDKNQELLTEKKEIEKLVNTTLKPELHDKYTFVSKIKGFLNALINLKSKFKELQEILTKKDSLIERLEKDNKHLKNIILELDFENNDFENNENINTVDTTISNSLTI